MDATPSIESELVGRCRDGDGRAFECLLSPYRDRLLAYLHRSCGDPAQAEDLLQETLVRAWKGLGRYESQGRLASWLFAIAHRVAVDRARRAAVRPALVALPGLDVEGTDDPGALAMAGELEARLLRVVADLPDKQRQVFLLRQHGELKFREIAELRGEPLSTVLGHMHYAMKRLRRAVREHYERAS